MCEAGLDWVENGVGRGETRREPFGTKRGGVAVLFTPRFGAFYFSLSRQVMLAAVVLLGKSEGEEGWRDTTR